MKVELDREKAARLLDADDSVRQALANEFANQMAELGLEVTPRGGVGMRSTCISSPNRSSGAGAPTRRSRSTSSTIRPGGAITAATRARSRTPTSTRRLPRPMSRRLTSTGGRPCGTASRASRRRGRDMGLDRQRRPSLLQVRGPGRRSSKAAPARPRLVAGEQRRCVELGIA